MTVLRSRRKLFAGMAAVMMPCHKGWRCSLHNRYHIKVGAFELGFPCHVL